MGIGGNSCGNGDGLVFDGDPDVGEDEVSVRGEGEFVFPLERGMGEGIDADAGKGPLAGGEAKLIAGPAGIALEEPGVVGELLEFTAGGPGAREVDGEPVAFL